MKSLYFLITSLVFANAYSLRNYNTESHPIEIPMPVAKSIKDQYPSASNLRFSVLEAGKVYRADFEIAGRQVSLRTNRTQVLDTFEKSDPAVVSAISSKLVALGMGQGKLSNMKTLVSPGKLTRQVGDYFLDGTSYQLTVDASEDVKISAKQMSYETNTLEDLPEKIQTYIKERNKPNADYISKLPLLEKQLKDYLSDQNELGFSSSTTYILPDKSTQYEVLVKFYGVTDLPLLFDQNGNLIWVGSFNRLESLANFDDMSGGVSNLSADELQYFDNQFKSNNQFKDYTIDGPISRSKAELNAYGNEQAYQFRLSKKLNSSDESWVLRYDKNKKLIDSYYNGRRK